MVVIINMEQLREKLQYECEEYRLYSPDSLKYLTDRMHILVRDKIKDYKELFGIEDFEQVQINYFDDIEKFRKFVCSMRGDEAILPEYAQGTYDRGMINAFLPNNLVVDSPKYKHRLFMANHELFHILYMKYILHDDYTKRIVWYDEGMAQLMSGEKSALLDLEVFKRYYSRIKESTKEIPDFVNIQHGTGFCNELYNGYALSYLAVRYLSDLLSKEEFKELLRDVDKVNSYSKSILSDMFDYYDALLFSNGNDYKINVNNQ